MRAIQYLLEKPILALMMVPLALMIGFLMGQVSAPIHPVDLIQYRPAQVRKIKALEKTAKSILESEIGSVAEELAIDEGIAQPTEAEPTQVQVLDVTQLSVDQLVNHLQLYKSSDKITEDELNQNLRVSEELVKREPDLYLAYKLKLKMLLLKETQFGQEVEPEEYEDLYGQLLSFEGESEIDELLASTQEAGDETAPGAVTSPELAGIDPEVIHAPFLRYSALNDLEGLAEVAEDYIEEFPTSYLGYLYLAEAHWRSGEEEEAVNILKNGLGAASGDDVAAQLFTLLKASPVERIQRLSIR